MPTTMTLNEVYNGIELSFSGIPSASIRAELKKKGFHWHGRKRVWYAKQTEDRIKFAQTLTENKVDVAEQQEIIEPERAHDVKVGDVFYTSWGYDQTNVNFFQVIALKGKCSAIVREVALERIKDNSICPISAERAYKVSKDILPPTKYSVFINDNENGDIRRIKNNGERTYISVGKRGMGTEYAYPYHGETVYESWDR